MHEQAWAYDYKLPYLSFCTAYTQYKQELHEYERWKPIFSN